MNPIFDLIVIGVIVSMVLLNLYLSKEPSHETASFRSSLAQKLNAFNPLGQKPALGPYASTRISQD